MPEISVIVPVYNVEDYLQRCIDSILAQSFSDFELILVDDGSTDRSVQICKEYKEKDSRIHIICKMNGGVSSARNKGIESAIGEYLAFCDSDDYVDPLWLQTMYDKIVDSGVDCVATNYREVSESGLVLHESSFCSNVSFFSSDKDKIDYIINSVLSSKTGWSIWNRLFKSKLIKDNLIRFCENCENYAEDLGFFIEYLLVSQAVSNVENCVYNYYQRSGSKMNTVRCDMNLNAINQMAKHIKKSFISSVLREYYPIIVYKIFYCTEYLKIYSVDFLSIKDLSTEVKKIVDIHFFKENNRKCICSKKPLLEYYSKNETSKIRYFLWYLNHGSYKIFVICDIVFHKFIYKKDT